MAIFSHFAVATPLAGGAERELETCVVDFPTPYTIVQRDADGLGVVEIRGRVLDGSSHVAGRYRDGDWTDVDCADDGSFRVVLAGLTTGSGWVEVRAGESESPALRVEPVGIGDVFLVTGQSNAAGRGTTLHPIDRSLSSFAAVFPEQSDAWQIADDPVTHLGRGSPWPLVANDLLREHRLPIGLITVTEGGESVYAWEPGQRLHRRVIERVEAATAGTMRIRGVLWFQGERDMKRSTPSAPTTEGDGDLYRQKLARFVDDIVTQTSAEFVVIGQSNVNRVNDAPLGVAGINNIRAAQEALWSEHPRVKPGPITYDISLGKPTVATDDWVHFTTEEEMTKLATRWSVAVEAAFYGGDEGIGPRLRSVRRSATEREIIVEFDVGSLPLRAIENPTGFSISDAGTFLGPRELQARIGSDGSSVILTTPVSVSPAATLSLGSHFTAWGRDVPRDSSAAALPAMPFFDHPIL